ncbi:phosphate acyltransferase [bacterium BMS3Bbin06]|nr:phosphate acyltransferase [bacterium BMS3Abin08]GBE33558.1 phosphate acyltransferase [bacterium BMS3Bbin06]HDO36487.1 phosphate acyltransferase PlsX [Nitrospirota bacterium]HDY71213.1 phosphate acyltransferase PlsX [Nitrospirota bacterium]
MKIALDAMGGDHAPEVTVEGAVETVNGTDDLDVILIGDGERIADELKNKKYPAERISIIHASQTVTMDESISLAIRRKKDSSIRRGIEMVRDNGADAFVSAGHSGVVMGTALLLLGTSEGVDRPAIAATMPTLKGRFVLIDAGANVDTGPENLVQFALMGNAYCKNVLAVHNPRVGLLSIGEEDIKGNELTKETFGLLKKTSLNFVGNIEGKDLFHGDVDVVVCDGFIGNIALKISEGLAESILKMLKREIASVATGRLAYMFLKPALKNFKKKTDYAEYGGAPLLGLNGTCIISHGRSTSKAIRNALKTADIASSLGVDRIISQELKELKRPKAPDLAGSTV